MVVLNPQWQGSGATDEIKSGARIIGNYFSECIDFEVELSEKDLSIENGIMGYHSIYMQMEHFRQVVQSNNPKHITTIGGDCSVEIIPVSYLNYLYDKIAIIWLDAHADLNTPESSPSKTFHGMPLRLLLGEGDGSYKKLLFSTIDTSQILYVGLRDIDKSEEEYIINNNIFNTLEINYLQIKQKIAKHNFNKIYIHLDLDIIDPSFFQHTKCPTADGLRIDDLETLINQLQNDFDIVGYSICESVANKNEHLLPIQNILKMIKYGTLHNNSSCCTTNK